MPTTSKPVTKHCERCKKPLKEVQQFDCKGKLCKSVMCSDCFYEHRAECSLHDQAVNVAFVETHIKAKTSKDTKTTDDEPCVATRHNKRGNERRH